MIGHVGDVAIASCYRRRGDPGVAFVTEVLREHDGPPAPDAYNYCRLRDLRWIPISWRMFYPDAKPLIERARP